MSSDENAFVTSSSTVVPVQQLKLKKCTFLKKEFVYLGYLVKDGYIAPNPSKVKYLILQTIPKNTKEVRSILGLFGYFRKFINNYTDIIQPIQLLLKSKFYEWNQDCNEAFEKVKSILTSEPLLKLPDFNLPFVISCDASGYGIGAVLEQENHPISYYSRKLHAHELNYSNYEKEALAVVSAVKQFQKYMLHAKTVIFTDNSAVSAIFNAKDTNGRILRWISFLSSFDIEIRHRNGKSNLAADYLSRHPINIVKHSSIDDQLNYIYENLVAERQIFKNYLVISQELYYRKGHATRKVIMTATELTTLLNFLHNQLGHASIQPIYLWISSRFFRPNLYSSIKTFIDSCHVCQLNSSRQPKYDFSGSLGVSGLFLAWSIDFLGPLPISSNGYYYIFIAVEHLSRFPIAIPCKDVTGAPAAHIVLTSIICNFGTPTSIYLDEGTSFTCHYFRNFLCKWNIDPCFAPPGSHELNGIAERMCRTVRLKLTRAVNSQWSNWDTTLPTVILGLRSQITKSTGYTPFSILYGFEPRLPIDTSIVPRNLHLALRLIENSAISSKRLPLCKSTVSSNSPTFPIHSLVLVQRNRKKHTTDTSYMGPFRIIAQFPHNRYSMVAENGKVKLFHASRLIPYRTRHDAFFEGGSVG
jgi:flagellin-specific chaperone FliS